MDLLFWVLKGILCNSEVFLEVILKGRFLEITLPLWNFPRVLTFCIFIASDLYVSLGGKCPSLSHMWKGYSPMGNLKHILMWLDCYNGSCLLCWAWSLKKWLSHIVREKISHIGKWDVQFGKRSRFFFLITRKFYFTKSKKWQNIAKAKLTKRNKK